MLSGKQLKLDPETWVTRTEPKTNDQPGPCGRGISNPTVEDIDAHDLA